MFDIDTLPTIVAESGASSLAQFIFKIHLSKLTSYPTKKEIEATSFTDYYDETLETLEKYYENLYAKNQHINTIIDSNSKPLLLELYIPLTLEIANENVCGTKHYKVDDYCNIFDDYSKIIIQDSAGMGKTTIIKYLINSQIDIQQKKYVPIFIPLRNLPEHVDIFQYIYKEFCKFGSFQQEALDELLKYDEIVIYFDGYDEISEDLKNDITSSVITFVESYPEIKYVISSREDCGLNIFCDFNIFKIKPLNLKQTYNLIKKYDCNNALSDELIKAIKSSMNRNIFNSLLTNPFLVTILYRSYKYNQSLPNTKLDFFDNIFNALYYELDESKNGFKRENIPLNITNLKKVLCYFSDMSLDKLEFTPSEFYDIIESISQELSLDIDALALKDALIINVPYFYFTENKLIWTHKSFKEYFYALFLMKYENEKKEKISRLVQTYAGFLNNNNILEFCFQYDKQLFIKNTISQNLVDFKQHFENAEIKYKELNLKAEYMDLLKTLTYYINRISISEVQSSYIEKDRVYIELYTSSDRDPYIINHCSINLFTYKLNGKAYSIKFSGPGPEIDYLLNFLCERGIDIFDYCDYGNINCTGYLDRKVDLYEFLIPNDVINLDFDFLVRLNKLSLLEPFCVALYSSFCSSCILNYPKVCDYLLKYLN